jgi:hypothetical protein
MVGTVLYSPLGNMQVHNVTFQAYVTHRLIRRDASLGLSLANKECNIN